MAKVCPQCGFAENPDRQETCVICKADITLVPVARRRRKPIYRNIALFCVGLGLFFLGFYWYLVDGIFLAFFIILPGMVMAFYLGGLERTGNHQRLWKVEYDTS
jgi:apolipoprotein N-acyltransferase